MTYRYALIESVGEERGEGVEWPWERWSAPFYKLLALEVSGLIPQSPDRTARKLPPTKRKLRSSWKLFEESRSTPTSRHKQCPRRHGSYYYEHSIQVSPYHQVAVLRRHRPRYAWLVCNVQGQVTTIPHVADSFYV